MGDNFATWQNVLIKWVNSLDLQDTTIQNISELGDGKFFYSLLNVISHTKKHGSSVDEADKAVTEFLKYQYPFYIMESKSCEMEDLEIMYVTSLLMLHCVLKSQNKNIMEHMFKLDDETQVYIKNFFETIMQYDNNITRNVVKHAVSQCGNNKSLKETMKGHSTESPLVGFSTPKRSPIMDVVQSPLALKLKQLSEQRTVIERLNNELDAEQAEKVMLQEELQQERDKTKKLTRQLIDRKDEMKKLHEEWLYNDSESNQKAQCGNSCQEALLKKQIKDLETYISSLHGDIDVLHNKQDLLQQRVLKAEHQYQVWYAESQQNEALCEKLKLDVVKKECELAHTKELYSELQRHMQEIKQVHNISVEEDPCFTSPGCRTPENLCQAVIDLRLHEQLEENKIITEQVKKLIIEEEVMKKQICDLKIRAETTECEADTLKATNLELQGKVDKMEALQHEFEECRKKQACLSQELDVLSQIYAEERQAHENDVRNLESELRNAEASRDKLKQDYSTSETERESMLALKIKLEEKINILNVETADVKSCLLLLKEQQENLIATHNKQIEEKEETIHQERQAHENDVRSLKSELRNAEASRDKFKQDYITSETERESMFALKIKLEEKINILHVETADVKSCLILLKEQQENLIATHNKQMEETEEIICQERQAHENDVRSLKSELRNAEASRDKFKQDYITSETERESMLALKINLEEKINILNVETADVKSCLLLLKEQQENLIATHNKQIEEKEETIHQERQAHENDVRSLKSELRNAEASRDKFKQDYITSETERESMFALKINLEEKINILHVETADVKSCLILLKEQQETLIATHNKQMEETEEIICQERQAHENDVRSLKSELRNAEASRDKFKQDYITSETERESMLALKINLEEKINILNVETADVKSCLLLLKEQQENLIATHNKQIEEKEETIRQERQAHENDVRSLKSELRNAEASRDKFKQDYITSETERESMFALKIKLEEKINILHVETADVKSCLILLKEQQENLIATHNKQMEETEEIICQERQAHENDVRSLKSELRNAEASRDKFKQDYITSETERESMLALKIKLEEKINILNVETADVKSCLILLKEQQENRIATHNKQMEETEEIICQERQAHENDVRSLKSELRNAEASRDKFKQDYITSETERESMLALKIKLEEKINILNVETADVKSCLILLKEQQENLIATHNKQMEETEEIICQERQAHENDVRSLKSELRNAEASRDKFKQDYITSETERESMLALKINLEEKINILNVETADVKSCLLLLKEQQENLISTHNKQMEEKEETIFQLVKEFSVLQDEIYSLEDEKRNLGTQLDAANSGLSELQMCKEHLLQLCNNMKDENKILQLTNLSLDRKVEELLHEMNTVIEELEKVKASELLLQENKLRLLEQHSEELHKREEKINRLLKDEHCLNEEKKKMDLMQTQMNEFMCERKIVSELCSVLRENFSSLQAVVASVQDQNTHQERDVGQKVLISKTEHMDGICKELIGDDAECLHIPCDFKTRLPAEQWSSYSVTDISVYTGELGSKGDDSAVNRNLLEKSSDLPNSQNLCLEEEGIPLEAELAALKTSGSQLQMDHKEDIDTNVSKVVNNLEILNADLVSTRGEIMQILKSNDILQNALSNAEQMCCNIAQKHKDLTIRIEILNSENRKLLKDIEKLENLKSLMEINEKALAAERSLNAELKADKEAFGELYIMLKDDFQKLNTDHESLNILIGTMKDQTLNLQKHNLELTEKLQKYEVSHQTCEENCRKLKTMREERHAEFNGLLNSETVLRQKMADFQRSFKDICYKFENIVLGTTASCNELKVIDCQRTELEELLTLMCIECEEILHSILKWTYRSLQKTEQNMEDQYLGISVYFGANEPPESVLSLGRGSESEVTKDTVGVNMKTWPLQELDVLQLQIHTLIAGIEVALKKCASVDSQCNCVLEMYNTNTESNNALCDRGAFCNVRDLNHVDRTNLIRDILTKLQGSEKNDAELVVVEDGWNPEDFLGMNPGAKSNILSCKENALKEHKKNASGRSVMLKMRLKLEQKLDQKTTDNEFLNAQNKSLQAVLDKEQNLKTEMERKLNEIKALHEALANEKEMACKLKFAEEEKCKLLEIELEKVSGVRQAYETLLEVNFKLQSEIDDMKSKLDEEKKAIRHEYEKKLDKLKAKTKALYEEEVEKKTKKSKEESEHLRAMCRFYKDKIWSYENDVGILKSQVWEIGDKLLLTEREKKKLEEELSKQEMFVQPIGRQDDFSDRHGALSNLERGRKIAGSSREVHTLDIIDESITFVRRKKSVPRSLPSGMGAMFDPEDEEGEVFNTTNLADLKAGRCLPEGYKGRISELQYRNSLCPPHLKSSYPAETQFHDPRQYRDEDLKLGCAVDVDQYDSLSTSMLLPSEKQRKKDRGQTSYKKPGPPTPGKNGGRLSLQGTEVLTPRAPLRESNDGASVRKVSTPSRLKSLFMTKNRRDENTPVTPRGRRLSNIFRRQVKNHP